VEQDELDFWDASTRLSDSALDQGVLSGLGELSIPLNRDSFRIRISNTLDHIRSNSGRDDGFVDPGCSASDSQDFSTIDPTSANSFSTPPRTPDCDKFYKHYDESAHDIQAHRPMNTGPFLQDTFTSPGAESSSSLEQVSSIELNQSTQASPVLINPVVRPFVCIKPGCKARFVGQWQLE
jgi:hypothetical protein